MKSFMVRGTNSLLQWILDLRTYGMRVSFSTTQSGSDLLLFELFLLSASVEAPLILWSTIADNPSEIAVGWSFLQDSRTIWSVDGS
ncbi:unnamed protein product [Penicillium salamii]|nr:unnamed protein product [Penicillium salamii]